MIIKYAVYLIIIEVGCTTGCDKRHLIRYLDLQWATNVPTIFSKGNATFYAFSISCRKPFLVRETTRLYFTYIVQVLVIAAILFFYCMQIKNDIAWNSLFGIFCRFVKYSVANRKNNLALLCIVVVYSAIAKLEKQSA